MNVSLPAEVAQWPDSAVGPARPPRRRGHPPPGLRPDRQSSLNVGRATGQNVYAIRHSDAPGSTPALELTDAGEDYRVAVVQHHQVMAADGKRPARHHPLRRQLPQPPWLRPRHKTEEDENVPQRVSLTVLDAATEPG